MLSNKASGVLAIILCVAAIAPSYALAAKKKTAPQPADTSPVVTPDETSVPSGTAAPVGTVQVAPFGSAPVAPQPYSIPVGGAGQAQSTAAAPQAKAQAPPEPPVVARAEQCLITNAELVSRTEPSPKLAVDLLLTDVCAAEVDSASLYARNVEALARYNPLSERGRAGLSIARADPETGQITAPQNVDVSSAVEAADRAALVIAPRLRKYAADLVLNEKVRLMSAGKKGH